MKITVTFEYAQIQPTDKTPGEIAAQVTAFLNSIPGVAMVDAGVERRERPAASTKARVVAAILVEQWNDGRPDSEKIRMTETRIRKVQARLADGFTEAQLSTVVIKLKKSPFHNGENDRGWVAPGPEWVLNTAEKVEQWLRSTEFRQKKSYSDEIKDFFQ